MLAQALSLSQRNRALNPGADMSSHSTFVIAFVFSICSAAGTQVIAADDVGVANVVALGNDTSVTLAVPRLAARLAALQRVTSAEVALSQFPGRSRGVQRPRCESKKKATLIGAAIGGVAGAAVAMYVIRGSGAVLGTANGAKRYIVYWTAGGAGGGALAGFAYCR
jgi:hypothetical protein